MSSPATSNSIPIVKSPGTPTGNHTGGEAVDELTPNRCTPLSLSSLPSQTARATQSSSAGHPYGGGAMPDSIPMLCTPLPFSPSTSQQPHVTQNLHAGGRGQWRIDTHSPIAPLPEFLPSHIAYDTQCLTAGHVSERGAMVNADTQKTAAPLSPLCPAHRPSEFRHPHSTRRWAHSQGEGPYTKRHPMIGRPSPCTLSVQPLTSRNPKFIRWAHTSQGKPWGQRHPIERRFPETRAYPLWVPHYRTTCFTKGAIL
jgi:hypothetical protein